MFQTIHKGDSSSSLTCMRCFKVETFVDIFRAKLQSLVWSRHLLQVNYVSIYEPIVAHQARSISSPPWMGCQSIAGFSPRIKFAGTHLYTWVERGTVRVKCIAQEHNTISRAGLEPGPLALQSSALTMRPPRLPAICYRTPFILQYGDRKIEYE